MIKKTMFAVLCVALLFAVFSCGDDGPSVSTYTGKDSNGKEYKLIVTGGDYELLIGGESISTGKVSKSDNILTLTPNGGNNTPFKVTVMGKDITQIEGDITDDNGNTVKPGNILPPFTPVAGNWNWFTSDDSNVNGPTVGPAYVDPQTTFPPGGVSKITNAVDVTGLDGIPGKGPYTYPAGEAKDNEGKAIDATVFNFTGNTKVDPEKNSKKDYGAGWPLVGWEAQPADEETAALLKTAYGYSFWVRLNSSSTNNDSKKDNDWAYLTAVVTDFLPERGHEYKHWFGNKPGDSGGNGKINNYTSKLQAGTWYKITVIMSQGSGFNLYQDKWIWLYPSGENFRGDFNQSAASKIQWQIPLQHNGGSQRGGEPYDQISGTHDFNLDFYGLELLIK
jgi:hypothetical protein